jgi:hypothetical protein
MFELGKKLSRFSVVMTKLDSTANMLQQRQAFKFLEPHSRISNFTNGRQRYAMAMDDLDYADWVRIVRRLDDASSSSEASFEAKLPRLSTIHCWHSYCERAGGKKSRMCARERIWPPKICEPRFGHSRSKRIWTRRDSGSLQPTTSSTSSPHTQSPYQT